MIDNITSCEFFLMLGVKKVLIKLCNMYQINEQISFKNNLEFQKSIDKAAQVGNYDHVLMMENMILYNYD